MAEKQKRGGGAAQSSFRGEDLKALFKELGIPAFPYPLGLIKRSGVRPRGQTVPLALFAPCEQSADPTDLL